MVTGGYIHIRCAENVKKKLSVGHVRQYNIKIQNIRQYIFGGKKQKRTNIYIYIQLHKDTAFWSLGLQQSEAKLNIYVSTERILCEERL